MCSTLEYAKSRLTSLWPTTKAAATAIENRPKDKSSGRVNALSPAAAVTSVMRASPRNAALVSAPAMSAPTTLGASPYVSGFQVCIGASPIFVP